MPPPTAEQRGVDKDSEAGAPQASALGASAPPRDLKTRLRLLLPAPLKPLAKRARNALDPILIARHRLAGERRPIPPSALRARAGEPAIGRFFASAQRSVDDLEAAVCGVGRPLEAMGAILDFGCGCCRILQEVAHRAAPGAVLCGCDIDDGAVAWAQRHHGTLSLTRSPLQPPLAYAEASFDLVYSSSVFTHLEELAQRRWLEEFSRLLRPGGLAVVSVWGEYAFEGYRSGRLLGVSRDFCTRLADSEKEFGERGSVFLPYERSAWNDFGYAGDRASSYGMTFNSAAQVRSEWSAVFDVQAIVPRGWWLTMQDLVILQRRPGVAGAPPAGSPEPVAEGG